MLAVAFWRWVTIMVFRVVGLILLIALLWVLFMPKAHAADAAVGDSIAVGTGHALHISTYGRVGAGSCEIVRRVPRASYRHLVISAGINDNGACVAAVRARAKANIVIWILPAPINAGRAAVLAAMRPGDRSVSYACAGGCTKSNFHPASYAVMAKAIRNIWN